MERFLNKAIVVLLSISPVGLFVIKGWVSAILFLSSLIAIILISQMFFYKLKNGKIESVVCLEKSAYPMLGDKWPAVIMIALAFPVFAVFGAAVFTSAIIFVFFKFWFLPFEFDSLKVLIE
jgi:hypothetical protein